MALHLIAYYRFCNAVAGSKRNGRYSEITVAILDGQRPVSENPTNAHILTDKQRVPLMGTILLPFCPGDFSPMYFDPLPTQLHQGGFWYLGCWVIGGEDYADGKASVPTTASFGIVGVVDKGGVVSCPGKPTKANIAPNPQRAFASVVKGPGSFSVLSTPATSAAEAHSVLYGAS
ncbi:hypothetical protein V500_10438 [Pseudogymnoascus sp. VKM F-4518 (FW-2643)]|nr:hypothetical protein V500_10438 [Pseudogymnoascus sp. VKM F-4518 (FW-2643)]